MGIEENYEQSDDKGRRRGRDPKGPPEGSFGEGEKSSDSATARREERKKDNQVRWL